MSLLKIIPSLLVATLAVGMATAPAKAQNIGPVVITDLDLTGVSFVDGVLTATGGTVSGTIAGLPFTTNITDFALELIPNALPGQTCSVLDLALGPINLNVLGLFVNTSPICLSITAIEGGGLLGNLLCGLADDLGIGDLGEILGLTDLLNGLPNVLSPVLSQALANAAPVTSNADTVCEGECEILDLVLGPVDLTLLGLNVHLDNCDNGPVEVCISATAGQGLLGDLLCGLADGGILPDLGNLLDLLDTLGNLLDDLSDLNLTAKQLNNLVNQVGRALRDGELTDNELDKLAKSITKLIKKA